MTIGKLACRSRAQPPSGSLFLFFSSTGRAFALATSQIEMRTSTRKCTLEAGTRGGFEQGGWEIDQLRQDKKVFSAPELRRLMPIPITRDVSHFPAPDGRPYRAAFRSDPSVGNNDARALLPPSSHGRARARENDKNVEFCERGKKKRRALVRTKDNEGQ